MIGGVKQYAQSVKYFVRSEKLALGDVKNKHILVECKLRDYATKKFRKEHPAKPYKSFNIEFAWWNQLVQECADINKDENINRIPVMMCKPKFGREEHILVIVRGEDWMRWMQKVNMCFNFPTVQAKQSKKSVTIKYFESYPKLIIINDEQVLILDIHMFNYAKPLWYQNELEGQ